MNPPSYIGPYKVLELLGQGGMGEVYLAEQAEPVSRRVAVKVIRPGMDTKAVLARFEAERQALAIMDHPSIAKVLDAGTTEDGRPYFVMEYVKGVPLTDYCDLHKLPTEDRLGLFIELCGAVQHAHQKGVIHRDLKPSNVLVTVPNGHPVPKVIDFGIAKAMGYKLTELTLHTQQGQPVGTPAYMSPEQAEMTGLDVDTRTDVYTLGVMLYELLVGTIPIDMRDIPATALSLALRETDPPKPSDRFDTLGDQQDRIAELRQTDPGSLRSQVRGDLDWIVMKAMEKDRTRRYETVNGLALDVRRHLNDEPVLAAAPSAGYRVRKFVRRHRVGVVAGGVALVGIAAGSAAALVGMVRSQRSEERAVAEASAAREVADFLVSLFEVSDPRAAQGDTVSAREVLDRGADRIRAELDGQPVTQARLMQTIGWVYFHLGLFHQADSLMEGSARLRERELGPQSLDLAETLFQRGLVAWNLGRATQAESLYHRALAIREEVLGPSHADVAAVLSNLGSVYQSLGRLEEAAVRLRRAIEIRQSDPDQSDSALAYPLNNLANVYFQSRAFDEAETMYRRAVVIFETFFGPNHPELATALANLGQTLLRQEEYTEAARHLERSLEIRQRAFEPGHPNVALSFLTLGQLFERQDRFEDARPYFEQALDMFDRALGADHLYTAAAKIGLAHVYVGQGRFDEAEALASSALAYVRSALTPEHPLVSTAMERLAESYVGLGRYSEAEELYGETLLLRERAFGDDDVIVARTLEGYSTLLREVGRTAEADSLEARARAIRDSQESGG